jgi:AcrR family transcriptional regulator
VAEVRGKRGLYRKSRDRREWIARAVLGIVDAAGPEAVTVAGVAEAAGMPEPSLLYHYPTKDDLLLAALGLADDEVAEATGAESANIALDLDVMRDQGLGPQWQSRNRQRLDAAMRAAATDPDHPAHGFIAERNRRALRAWSQIVANRQRAGLADPSLDPEAVAWQLIAVLEGFSTFAIAEPSGWGERGLRLGDLLADAVLRLTGAPRDS